MDNKGKIIKDSKPTFNENKIPNGDFPFDHLIVTTNTTFDTTNTAENIGMKMFQARVSLNNSTATSTLVKIAS